MTTLQEFFIGTDCSGHHYIVPYEHKAEWDEWSELDDLDERAWTTPDYAIYLDGGQLVFSGWRIDK